MANKTSSKKDIRKTARRTERNRAARSRLKTLSKHARSAEGAADTKVASEYMSALDKAVKTGLIHRNQADRRKARLAKKQQSAAAP